MAFGTNKKLKVLWICHFTNLEIQKKLNPIKPVNEMAPWISLGIEEVKKRNDIELIVISPHRWIKKDKYFEDRNIKYYFIKTGMPLVHRHWPRFFRFDIYTNYYFNRKKIKKIISKVKPDIIHLHGAENAYYSSSMLDHLSLPHLITIQGFVSLGANMYYSSKNLRSRIDIEKKILCKGKNFGVRANFMEKEILKYNRYANFYWHAYFVKKPRIKTDKKKKKYDVVFFAQICKAKGIEDLIKAIGIVKKKKEDIKLAIIGNSNRAYITFLKGMAKENNCKDNIDFLGFQSTHEDLYKKAVQAKLSVLPTYNDIIPGTIIESMYLGIPVISYKVGGLIDLDFEPKVIELVEKGNIKELANKIIFLLENNEIRKALSEMAKKYVFNRWNNKKALDDIIKVYVDIIQNFDTSKQ